MFSSPAIDTRNIHPLTEFLRNAKSHIAKLKESGEPEVLTVNGRAEVVVVDANSYQELLDRLERAEFVQSLRDAVADIRAGNGISLEDLEAELNERYGV